VDRIGDMDRQDIDRALFLAQLDWIVRRHPEALKLIPCWQRILFRAIVYRKRVAIGVAILVVLDLIALVTLLAVIPHSD
jgi:hypothetical protein